MIEGNLNDKASGTLKCMLDEYRANVIDGVPTAIQARDFLNGYKDDDTGTRLGDRLISLYAHPRSLQETGSGSSILWWFPCPMDR